MLLLLWNFGIPFLRETFQGCLDPIMTCVFVIVGIVMLLGAVGITISHNVGSVILGAIFRGAGYVVRGIVRCFRAIMLSVPHIYTRSRLALLQMGLTQIASRLVAVILMILYIIVII